MQTKKSDWLLFILQHNPIGHRVVSPFNKGDKNVNRRDNTRQNRNRR